MIEPEGFHAQGPLDVNSGEVGKEIGEKIAGKNDDPGEQQKFKFRPVGLEFNFQPFPIQLEYRPCRHDQQRQSEKEKTTINSEK